MNLEIHERRKAEKARGGQAREILRNPLLIEAFDRLEERIIRDWRGSKAEDTDYRERAFMQLAALTKVRVLLTAILETGKMAEQKLSEESQEGIRT